MGGRIASSPSFGSVGIGEIFLTARTIPEVAFDWRWPVFYT